ncbi:hypothetical protein P9139_13770 [Curtobacterium flaccumfaciens]|nr:hypothetical protein P9139_13770 [Curtobacterium flaccumfaciens]
MTQPDAIGRRDPLLPDATHALSVPEVRLLWSFVHGDIMDGGARQQLRDAWGLCDRHSWGHAVVEIELWQYGAGAAGGHQPFDVCILYDDLLETALHRLHRARSRKLRRRLLGTEQCAICRDLGGTEPGNVLSGTPVVGYAGSDSQGLTEEVSRFRYTGEHVRATKPSWESVVCPACAADCAMDPHPDTGIVCRRHLAELDDDGEALEKALGWLQQQRDPLRHLIDTMTQSGGTADLHTRGSWASTLSWFHGWSLPLALTRRHAEESAA